MKWTSKIAIQRYNDLRCILGEPNWMAPQECGNCGWNCRTMRAHGLCFSKIMIVDESIRNMEHCECLYVSINANIPDEYLDKVLGVSNSLFYDKLQQTLTARSHFIGACVATLYLALLTVFEDITPCAMKVMHAETVFSASKPKGLVEIYNMLCQICNNMEHHFPTLGYEARMCNYKNFHFGPMNEISVLSNPQNKCSQLPHEFLDKNCPPNGCGPCAKPNPCNPCAKPTPCQQPTPCARPTPCQRPASPCARPIPCQRPVSPCARPTPCQRPVSPCNPCNAPQNRKSMFSFW